MEIRIDRGGLLAVDSVKKYCPLVASTTNERLLGSAIRCGDWCPLFGEPAYGEFVDAGGIVTSSSRASPDTLQICQGRVLEGEIIDERPKGEPK